MIVDSHVHIFPPEFRRDRKSLLLLDRTFSDLYSNHKFELATADDLIEDMDKNGVDVSVVMSIGWTNSGLAEKSNKYIAESCRRFPNRLIGFGSIDLSSVNSVNQIINCAEMGLIGVGELHPDNQNFDVGDSDLISPAIKAIREQNLILGVHCSEPVGHLYSGKGSNTPDKLEKLLLFTQGVQIILSHWGGGLPFYALMPEISELLSTVFFDTAASPFLYNKQIFEIVDKIIGPDHILAASDYPLISFSRVKDEINASSLPKEDIKLILGGNAKTLFNIS